MFGVIFFAELPDMMTGVGALIIFASTWYIARREAKLRAATKAAKPGHPV